MSALRTTTGLLLSTAVRATGCGGGSLFDIEVENKTSHFAIFNLWALAAGKNVEDVQHAFERARPAFEQGKEPKPGTFDGLIENANGAVSRTDPDATSVLPVNASSGRFVIACFVHTSLDARLQSEHLPPPAAVFVVPVELDVASPLSPP